MTESEASTSTHLAVDAGLLCSTDSSNLDASQYNSASGREAYLLGRALASTQALVRSLYALPRVQHPDHGPLASLPLPAYPYLPREKPLPKPRVETKWEKFAKRKGIENKKRDKLVWDEERKEWVPRWGYKGKNKDVEEQWIHEIPASKGDDFDPAKEAKRARRQRTVQNEAQRLRNVARAEQSSARAAPSVNKGQTEYHTPQAAAKRRAERDERAKQLDQDVRRGKISTASMGKFDRALQGEEKQKGLKRKFEPNEIDTKQERASHLHLLNKLGNAPPATKSKQPKTSDEVNIRKAVKFASDGKGHTAFNKGSGKTAGRKARK